MIGDTSLGEHETNNANEMNNAIVDEVAVRFRG
jgi:hypothetical protein